MQKSDFPCCSSQGILSLPFRVFGNGKPNCKLFVSIDGIYEVFNALKKKK